MHYVRPPFAAMLRILPLAALLLLAGCLPYSCRRSESTALLPADSLSRQVAADAPSDTLVQVWSTAGAAPLEYPRTVRFGQGDTIYVADVERSSLLTFAGERLVSETPVVEVPYLAGVEADTVALFSPATLTFYRIHDGGVVDSLSVNDAGRDETSLVYGALSGGFHYKRVDPESGGIVVSYDRSGQSTDTTRLDGPDWRHAGLLKTWGDSLVSLSGFRPVIDVVHPQTSTSGRSATADTLALLGFDSPMLARSRSFMLGETHEPPLLSSSAAAAGDRLFVLNMRAGWLQVDVFDRSGRLQHSLVQGGRDYRSSFFPQDLDVRWAGDAYELAVVYSQPEPMLALFRWPPSKSE